MYSLMHARARAHTQTHTHTPPNRFVPLSVSPYSLFTPSLPPLHIFPPLRPQYPFVPFVRPPPPPTPPSLRPSIAPPLAPSLPRPPHPPRSRSLSHSLPLSFRSSVRSSLRLPSLSQHSPLRRGQRRVATPCCHTMCAANGASRARETGSCVPLALCSARRYGQRVPSRRPLRRPAHGACGTTPAPRARRRSPHDLAAQQRLTWPLSEQACDRASAMEVVLDRLDYGGLLAY